jgi:hypothetical protein
LIIHGEVLSETSNEKATRLLGVYQDMDLTGKGQEAMSMAELERDLQKIYRKCYTRIPSLQGQGGFSGG